MKTNVRLGDFPYPLRKGEEEESRYLTWVRNHSNYMAERGFLDYMRIAAVLVRGIVVNFLTILPFILTASVLLAFAYGPLLDEWSRIGFSFAVDLSASSFREWIQGRAADTASYLTLPFVGIGTAMAWIQDRAHTSAPYLVTPIVAAFTLVWFFAFPMVIRIFKVITHRKAATAQESSVKLRDLYERSFGGLLVGTLAFAVVESLPILMHYFHAASQCLVCHLVDPCSCRLLAFRHFLVAGSELSHLGGIALLPAEELRSRQLGALRDPRRRGLQGARLQFVG